MLIDLDSNKSATLWKHPWIEEFVNKAWANGPPPETQFEHDIFQSKWKQRAHKIVRCYQSCVSRPRHPPMILLTNWHGRLLWASHVFYNLCFCVLLTVFVYSPTLLVRFPHPLEVALISIFFIPSLFPPYTATFVGYLTIDILFLISFIFRGLVFRSLPWLSTDVVTILLNARTLVSFLPLIQIFNVVVLTFSFPRLGIISQLIYPLLPIAMALFTGFFVTLHFLADTHNTARHTFDILLRTVLLDSHPGNVTQFHPVAARIVYYLFAFSSIYFFWGVGIAGIGMKIVKETDWNAERVRMKAIRLLKYLPNHKIVRKKKVLGRGKVLSSMPFNVLEVIGIVFRVNWLSMFGFYLGMAPIVVGWSLGVVCVDVGLHICAWMVKIERMVMDEVYDEIEDGEDMDSEDGLDDSTRLLS